MLVIAHDQEVRDGSRQKTSIQTFIDMLIQDSFKTGLPLTMNNMAPIVSSDDSNELRENFTLFKDNDAMFVLVIMTYECYKPVKLQADICGITTQVF